MYNVGIEYIEQYGERKFEGILWPVAGCHLNAIICIYELLGFKPLTLFVYDLAKPKLGNYLVKTIDFRMNL